MPDHTLQERTQQLNDLFLLYARSNQDHEAAALLPMLLDQTVLSELEEEKFPRDGLDLPVALMVKARKAWELNRELAGYYLVETRKGLYRAMLRGALHTQAAAQPGMDTGRRRYAYLDELCPELLARHLDKELENTLAEVVRSELKKEILEKMDRRVTDNLVWMLRHLSKKYGYAHERWSLPIARVIIHAIATNAPDDAVPRLIRPLADKQL